jgi:osmotically inducible protein OsmC
MPAKASAEWKGGLQTGGGSFSAGEGISGEVTFKSRFEDGPSATLV